MTIDIKQVSSRPLPTAVRVDSPSTNPSAGPARNSALQRDSFQQGTSQVARTSGPVVAPDAGAALNPAASAAPAVQTPEVIDVYFHVINKGTGAKNGNVTRAQIDAQVKVLNDAYQGTGFQFRLADVDRTKNAKWYTAEPGSTAELQMKRTLRKGDSEALNLYSASPSGGLLGWATFPNDYRGAPKQDGVVLLNSSLPGGSGAPYNEGDTATHEVGHWMGLFHTFDQAKGAGLPKGDLVSDTPAHEVNYGKPPENTDTLPKKPGLDPVHNYMNYTDDAWMSEFTPGQVTRMQEQWQQFRETDQAAT